MHAIRTNPLGAESAFNRAVAPRAPLYTLLDAARESAGPYQAEQAGLECRSLFAGDLGDRIKEVSPYIIEFPVRSVFRQWWFEQWGNSIGVLVEAPVTLEELRRHFRTLTVVRGAEDKKKYFFRFYDPRVLRVFLPACTPDEVKQFFGPITAFYCEGDGGAEFVAFTLAKDGVSVKRWPIVGTPAANAERTP
jgi:hypothetical protein